MDKLFDSITYKISRLITKQYSTSFSTAVGLLRREEQQAIYSIYGFVRYADEVVDTFNGIDKEYLLELFEKEYYQAAKLNASLNPVIHSFVLTVKKYKIDDELIQAFIKSMKTDLYKTQYSTEKEISDYIYGSADVVGLMCLKVFVSGDEALYNKLKEPAMRLGSAFQKVNFLRDFKNDTELLRRQYFPELTGGILTNGLKTEIVQKINHDFAEAYSGIKLLPGRSKLAVAIAYHFYKTLLKKIRKKPAERIMDSRIRLSGARKTLIFIKVYLSYILNLI
jgi:phytoene synthase